MGVLSGERIGRLSLRLDAAYCAVLGVSVAVAAPFVAALLPVPPWAAAVVGLVVVFWAGLIRLMAASWPLRAVLRVVMWVNLLAAALVAATSFVGPTLSVVLVVLAVAVDVVLFAASQAVALRRLRSAL